MSFAENKATPIATGDLGLDRTWINAEDKVQLISEPAQDTGANASAVKDFQYANDNHHERDQDNLSKRKRLSLSAKRVFHIGNDTTNKPLPAAPILADAPQTDSDSRLVSQPPIQETHKLKDLAHEPVGTVKSKVLGQGGHQAASNLAAKEISHGREVELVRAHDEIARARTETERLLAIKNEDEMMAARQDMFVRWTMDRHVTKMRILPRNTIHPKDRKEFVRRDAKGKERMDWEAYIVHVAEYYAEQYGGEYIGFTDNPPNPTKEVLVPSIERLLVSSAPLQEFVMAVRRIYRWEDWNETLKYLWAYSTLWALNLILPGLLAGVIYLIIHRKVRPPTIEDLRKDIMRTENLNETALTLAEFIEKEGDQRWVDPLIERVGPWLLVQLSDLANLMEVLRNFYEWRVPSRTGISIGILGLALLVVTLTPLWLLVRAITLAMGIIFFGLFPISSRFPDYRLIASPVKWVFWKIPTHAEWAVKVLQAEGARHRRADIPKPKPVDTTNYTPDPLGYRGAPEIDSKSASSISPLASIPEKDYGSYKCRGGHLIITSTGVRFESSPGRTGHWSLPYPAITRLEKMTRHVQKSIGRDSGDDLRLVGPDGMERVLLNMEKRDECFSQIVGYSDVTWQVVW